MIGVSGVTPRAIADRVGGFDAILNVDFRPHLS